MTPEQADLLEAYLQSCTGVAQAAVHERTRCAVIRYQGGRAAVLAAIGRFSYQDPRVAALAPLHSSRMLNRQYQEKLVGKVLVKAACSLFLPSPASNCADLLDFLSFPAARPALPAAPPHAR